MSQVLAPPQKDVKVKRKSAPKKDSQSPRADAVNIVSIGQRDSLFRAKIVRRLTDPKAKTVVSKVIRNAVSSPENAHRYLVRLGTLTKTGKVTRKYGGK